MPRNLAMVFAYRVARAHRSFSLGEWRRPDQPPKLGPPEGGVSRRRHDGGPVAPSRSMNEIGAVFPSAPCGRFSLSYPRQSSDVPPVFGPPGWKISRGTSTYLVLRRDERALL